MDDTTPPPPPPPPLGPAGPAGPGDRAARVRQVVYDFLDRRQRGEELSADCGKVVIRSGDAIVAEHPPAARRGESVTHKEHLDGLWKLAVRRTPAPPPSWRLTFDHAVAAAPLERYERLAGTTGAAS